MEQFNNGYVMKLLGDIANRSLSEKVAHELGVPLEYPEVVVFPDGEKRVRITSRVVDKKVYIIKSLAPPVADNLLEFCFLIDAAKRNGAKEVIGIVPYLGYARADHIFREGEAVPTEVLTKMLEDAGLSKIMFFDLHTIKIPELFKIPVKHESAASIFADKIHQLCKNLEEVSIISPDRGGVRRAKIIGELLGQTGLGVITKDRDLATGNIKMTEIEGDVRDICVIVDDLISTGGTISQAADYLLKKGAKTIYLVATHPVFVKDAVQLLRESRAEKVIVADTIALEKDEKFNKLEILSVAPIIARGIKDWEKG